MSCFRETKRMTKILKKIYKMFYFKLKKNLCFISLFYDLQGQMVSKSWHLEVTVLLSHGRRAIYKHDSVWSDKLQTALGRRQSSLYLNQYWGREVAISLKHCLEADCSFPLELWKKEVFSFLFITSWFPSGRRAVPYSLLHHCSHEEFHSLR